MIYFYLTLLDMYIIVIQLFRLEEDTSDGAAK